MRYVSLTFHRSVPQISKEVPLWMAIDLRVRTRSWRTLGGGCAPSFGGKRSPAREVFAGSIESKMIARPYQPALRPRSINLEARSALRHV